MCKISILKSPARACLFLNSLVLVSLNLTTLAYAQSAERLYQVRRLYVESLGQGPRAAEVRAHLIHRLRQSHRIQIVEQLSDADALAKGNAQVWTTGRFLLSPRSRASQTILEGFLSLEVIGKNNHTLWSYLVTPGKFSWNGVADDLAKQLVSKLVEDIEQHGQQSASVSSSAAKVRAVLQGAGATLPAPLYQKWFESFAQDHPEVQIAYDAVGSGEGMQRLNQNKIDFAASDMPLPDNDLSAPQAFIQVPMVLGAIVPIYNLPDLRENINFTPEILAGIYLGKITKWNDRRIRDVNPGAAFTNADIVVIHRSDASGTTFVWSDYLSKVSSEWKTSIGSGLVVQWPTGVGAAYNQGIAAAVQHTPNSIGYIEYIYAIQNELRFGSVRNQDGYFIKADIASVKAASTASSPLDHRFAVSITNGRGKTAYPIATYTWLLLPEQTLDTNKRTALRELVRWMLTSGQKSCSALGYVPLPDDIAKGALHSLEVEYPSSQ